MRPAKSVAFIEGAVFNTTVPVPARFFNDEGGGTFDDKINDTINDKINDTVNDTINDTVKRRFSHII